MSTLTAAPVTAFATSDPSRRPAAVPVYVEPEFLRIPEAVRFSGLGRSTLYLAIADGRLPSKCIRQRGALRGIRLISRDALRKFIEAAD